MLHGGAKTEPLTNVPQLRRWYQFSVAESTVGENVHENYHYNMAGQDVSLQTF